MNGMAVAATSSKSLGLILGLTLGIVFCITGILLFRDRQKKKKIRRKRRMENAGIQTSDSFRPNPSAEVI